MLLTTIYRSSLNMVGITFLFPKSCLLIVKWKIFGFCVLTFISYSLMFSYSVFIFLHNVYDHNTQRSSENLIIIPFMVTELCFLLEKWQFCCLHPLISDFLWQALRCFLQNVCALNTHVKINFDYSFLRFKRYASVYVN